MLQILIKYKKVKDKKDFKMNNIIKMWYNRFKHLFLHIQKCTATKLVTCSPLCYSKHLNFLSCERYLTIYSFPLIEQKQLKHTLKYLPFFRGKESPEVWSDMRMRTFSLKSTFYNILHSKLKRFISFSLNPRCKIHLKTNKLQLLWVFQKMRQLISWYHL